jgi:hypothetical protein
VIRLPRIVHNGAQQKPQFDDVICEEPLQIPLSWIDPTQPATEKSQVFTITMRTPGYDLR